MQKKWYLKKRYWIGFLLLVFWLIVSNSEVFRFRYQPASFAKSIETSDSAKLIFKKKEVATTTMNYCQLGNTLSQPLIVFVHGSPGSLAAFEGYLRDTLLSNRATLIAVDRLGFGYSDFGKAIPSLSLQAKLIATILQDFPEQPKIIVGHSMGGPVISKLAMDYPHLVDGLVLVAPSISPLLEPSNWWRKAFNFPILRWLTPAALRVCNQEIIPLEKELVDMENEWTNITCPVTVVQGTADSLVPPGNAYYAKEQLSNSSNVELIMIAEGDHFILWNKYALVRAAILEMLEEVKQGAKDVK